MNRQFKKISCVAAILAILVSIGSLSASAALLGDAEGFFYQLQDNDTAIIKEYHGSSTEIVLPYNVNAYNVIGIADSAFSKNNEIVSVVIPESIETIGEYAFYGCSSLERVEISPNVTKLEAATFYGCTNLKEAVIPASVTEIVSNAFAGCQDLVIRGEKDSAAESFAAEKGLRFIDINYSGIIGDADNNGTVDSTDALCILRMSTGLEEINEDIRFLFDVDEDESITSSDTLLVLRYSVGIESDNRIGQVFWKR